jgi:hypothetical protein
LNIQELDCSLSATIYKVREKVDKNNIYKIYSLENLLVLCWYAEFLLEILLRKT